APRADASPASLDIPLSSRSDAAETKSLVHCRIAPWSYVLASRERNRAMRKIIVGAQVSMDGVMQAPGGQTEDPTKGFKLGGWSMPYFDQVFGEEIDRLFSQKFDLLLGRKTYEIFAAYWPYYAENGGP